MDLSSLKEWFKKGIKKVIWFITLLSKRFHVELTVMKLMSEVEALKRQQQKELTELGRLVIELKKSSEIDLFSGYKEIEELFERIQEIEKKINELKAKAKDISSMEME